MNSSPEEPDAIIIEVQEDVIDETILVDVIEVELEPKKIAIRERAFAGVFIPIGRATKVGSGGSIETGAPTRLNNDNECFIAVGDTIAFGLSVAVPTGSAPPPTLIYTGDSTGAVITTNPAVTSGTIPVTSGTIKVTWNATNVSNSVNTLYEVTLQITGSAAGRARITVPAIGTAGAATDFHFFVNKHL
jgi:hypothetical protein